MTVQPIGGYDPSDDDSLPVWVRTLPAWAALAREVADTDFTPRSYNGNPAAVTAAFAYGFEVGLGPMTALRSINVINGRPTLSAESMRALALTAGHDIEVRESTAARCVVAGKRKGSTTWTTVTWDAEVARRAGLGGSNTWKAYPRAMLLARASAELCRAIFPDVIGGFAAVEEMTTDDDEQPTRQVRRRRTSGAAAEAQPAVPELPATRHAAEPVGHVGAEPAAPDLPEPEPEQAPRSEPLAGAPTWPQPDLPGMPAERPYEPAEPPAPQPWPSARREPEQPPVDPDGPYTDDQRKIMHARFNALQIPRPERLAFTGAVIGRKISSANELTAAEASSLIDTLVMILASDHPQETLDGIKHLHGLVVNEPMFGDDGEPL